MGLKRGRGTLTEHKPERKTGYAETAAFQGSQALRFNSLGGNKKSVGG